MDNKTRAAMMGDPDAAAACTAAGVAMPCPFCGKQVAVLDTCKDLEDCENFERCGDAGYYSTVCAANNGGCGSSSGYARSEEEALAAWNRRVRMEDENEH